MSSSTLSKSFSLSSALQETNYNKQGIVSILGFDTEKEAKSTTASLRRTISADMSSIKWLEQNSLASPIKKVASSEQLQKVCMEDDDQPSFEDLERPDQSEIWNSIQEANKKKELDNKKQATFDVWSCILTEKDSKASPPPYVHPLVNRSASSLSEKSLEVCTESLGSETGSDGFPYPPPSKTEGDEEDQEDQKKEKLSPTFDKENIPIVKFHYADRKKIQPRSFPPPLPSLSHGAGGSSSASLHMRPRRDNGRLVLEAVTVPSQNTFHAQRQDGRLVLSLADTSSYEEEEEEENSKNQEATTDEELKDAKEFDEIFPDFEQNEEIELDSDDDEEEDEEDEEAEMEEAGIVKESEEKNMEYVMDTAPPKFPNGKVNVNRLYMMASKPMALVKRNPAWINKLNEEVKPKEINQTNIYLAKSLPPRPPASRLMIPKPKVPTAAAGAAASLNAYEYCWRDKHNLPVQETSPLEEKSSSKLVVSKNLVANEQQQLQQLRGSSADRLVPLIKGCKETRRSLLFLEPHCIATS